VGTKSWGWGEEQKVRGIEWAAEESASPALEVGEVMRMEPGECGSFVKLDGFEAVKMLAAGRLLGGAAGEENAVTFGGRQARALGGFEGADR